jgi:hypothetical protein
MFLRAPEGIVMAADSRVTEGYTLSGPKTRDDSVKFIQLSEDTGVMTHGIYDIGISGITTLKEKVQRKSNEKNSGLNFIDEGKQIFLNAHNEWTRENPDIERRDKDVGFIVGGLDRRDMSFKVYCLESPSFDPILINGNLFLSGQWHIARFLLSKFMTRKASLHGLKKMAAVAISATASVDKTVGGPVRVATITVSDGFQWLSNREMSAIAKLNESFRNYFQELLRSSLVATLDR